MAWVIELKRLEDETSMMGKCQRKKPSIYKIPPRMTVLNKIAYQPQLVSFGPYHHGEEHLLPMEEHKHRAFVHFLNRTKMPLQIIADNLTNVVQDLKESYDSLGDVWQSDTGRFLRLMVLDGCFMLEVLYYYAKMSDSGNYSPTDPIFSTHGMLHVMHHIRRDMLLLENQLPLLVLIKLAAGICPEKGNAQEFVKELIFWFTKSMWPGTGECLHLLDVYRKGMPWSYTKREIEHTTRTHDESQLIVSAMELKEAGISIKRSKISFPNEISFKDRILRLPFLVVDDTTESVFWNLIAFERLHVGTGNEVTSYIFFMDTIIKSVRDVNLLKSNGIIQNASGSEEAVGLLFNLLARDIMYNPLSSMASVLHDINVYRRKPWVKYREKFTHAYHLSTQWNPWAYISIIFAILLFSLTLVQTAYTISPYYRPNK
ncbi:UPF0481 protein At3g47200-like [Actinidia eriantha]|uniref:UPF0481 protein At3g47200-like n=1 Tax=Actinidia eriantha TaxID=165200 RepID=UPI00258AF47A|nr:UPF0481 protein At3g47200-like [Actinidia eriantha]